MYSLYGRYVQLSLTIINCVRRLSTNASSKKKNILGPFIRGKIRRVLNKTRTFRINGTFHLR